MGKWITDRLPEYEEGFSGLVWGEVKSGTPCLRNRKDIILGEPWMEISPPEPHTKAPWKPEEGDTYFFIDSEIDIWKDIVEDPMHEFYVEKNRFQNGNFFQTEEQAQEAARRVKELLLNYRKEINND